MCRCEICPKPGVRWRLYQSSQSSSSGTMPSIKDCLIASDLITCIVSVFKKLLATLRKSVEAICLRKSSQMSLMNSGIKDFGGAHFGFTLLLNNNIKVFVPIYPSSHHAFPTFLNLCIAGNNMAGNLHRHEALQHHSIARLHLISEYNWECRSGFL